MRVNLMTRPAVLLKKSLIFTHRWLGVALSAIVLLWFVSGIVMMYWSYPSVTAADRLERLPVLDPATVKLSPEEAYARLQMDQPPAQVRLTSFDGRPVYRFRMGRGEASVYADDGAELAVFPQETIRRVAATWARLPAGTAREEEVKDVDQWTVQAQLRNLRPLWKYSFPDGQQVYVSEATGEVVQYTTTESRWWAYLGAIPHWLYFTPLRKHGPEWSQLVIWSSGIATVASLMGIVIGIWMYSPRRKRYRYAGAPSGIPYRGQKRWHTILGLIFGVLAGTWAFSGMLSMDPFPTRTGGAAGFGKGKGKGGGGGLGRINNALRGGRLPLSAFAAKPPREALTQAGGFQAKELEWVTVMGEPMLVAASGARQTLFIPLRGEPFREFPRQRVEEAVKRAARPAELDIRVLSQYDAYYLDRNRERPLPVLLVTEKGSDATRVYIDPKTARVVGNYSSSRWVSRWLYHGLHSLDFPWLYNHRPLWDIVVITLMLGGTALCVTSLILSWRVVVRKLAAIKAGRALKPSPSPEDLVPVD
jgi:uncharacterized iron-regulated membrane protein